MSILRRIMAWFSGEGFCPFCSNSLQEHEAGYWLCTTCSVAVDYEKGRWQFTGGQWRRLPGMAGMSFEKEDAA